MTHKIKWTEFPNFSAMSSTVREHSYSEFADYIKSKKGYRIKGDCPWLKLATFGNKRTDKNSLRHNMNMLTVTGVEGDYDGGMVTPEQAIAKLEKAGLKALVYTSPSYTDESPRWRVVAFSGRELPAHTRSHLMARVNGVLGGILSNESFTLSQSYYFGQVEGTKFQVWETFDNLEEGDFIDDCDQLDEIAIYKTPSSHPNDPDQKSDYSIQMFEMAVAHHGRKLKTGDRRRELLKSYIASRSGKNLLRDELAFMVEGVINKYFDPADPIDAQNIFKIIDDFAKKDSANTDQPADISFLIETSSPPVIQISKKENGTFDYPSPFRGPMKDIVDCALKCAFKPQPELTMMAVLVGMAACVNGEYSMQSGGRFNLFGIGSADSGNGKDHPRVVAEILACMGQAEILGRPGSGAGIEDALEARKSCLVTIDEMAHLLKAMNDERAPAHIVDIGSTLLKSWSASKSSYTRRTLAKGPNKQHHERPIIPNPCLSLIGFSTPQGFGDAFHEQNLKDGLIGRMIYVPGRLDVAPRRCKTGFEMPDRIHATISAFKPVDTFAPVGPIMGRGSIVLGESDAATALLDRLLVEVERNRDRTLDVAPSLYARTYEKIERVAGVLAVWDDPTCPVIKVDHVEWARDLIYSSDSHILTFVSRNMHANEVTKNTMKIKAMITRILHGEFIPQRQLEIECMKDGSCISRSQLLRISKMDKKSFDATLAHMQDLGDLEAFGSNGKPLPVIRNLDFKE